MSERKYCNHPDRHVPSLKCGHPLPCPWHTVIIEQDSGNVFYPEDAPKDEETKKKVRDIADALKDL